MAKKTPQPESDDLELTAEQQEAVDRWAASKSIQELLAETTEVDKNELVAAVFPLFAQAWAGESQPPANPTISTDVARCVLVVKTGNSFSVDLRGADDPKDALKQAGLSARKARVVAKYVVKRKMKALPPFDKLAKDKTTKAAAKSLLAAIEANPEWSALLKCWSEYTVADPQKFVKEVPDKATADDIVNICKVICPQVYPSQATHSGAMEAVVKRQKFEAATRSEHVVPGGKNKIVIVANKVRIYGKSRQGWSHLGTIKHESVEQAQQFADTILGDAEALASTLLLLG